MIGNYWKKIENNMNNDGSFNINKFLKKDFRVIVVIEVVRVVV